MKTIIMLRCTIVVLCILGLVMVANVWGIEKVIQSSLATLVGFAFGYRAGKS